MSQVRDAAGRLPAQASARGAAQAFAQGPRIRRAVQGDRLLLPEPLRRGIAMKPKNAVEAADHKRAVTKKQIVQYMNGNLRKVPMRLRSRLQALNIKSRKRR